MAAVAVKEAPAVTCGLARCIERGYACQACATGNNGSSAAPAAKRGPFDDGQAFFILRVKLLAACVEGEAFESAWAFASGAVVALSPQGQARSWRRAVEEVRPEFAEAYRRTRRRLAVRNQPLA